MENYQLEHWNGRAFDLLFYIGKRIAIVRVRTNNIDILVAGKLRGFQCFYPTSTNENPATALLMFQGLSYRLPLSGPIDKDHWPSYSIFNLSTQNV